MSSAQPLSLFDKYGGLPTMQRLVKEFFQRVSVRPGLARYFNGLDSHRIAEHQIEVVAYALGKPAKIYNFDQLAVAHHSLGITLSAYEEMIAVLRQVLLDAKLDGQDIITIINTLDQHRHRIVREVSAIDGLKTVHMDPVTGLGNELALQEALALALGRQASSLSPLTLMMFGLDQPEQVMSQAGAHRHAEVEKHIALLVLRTLREDDLVCRIAEGRLAVMLSAATIEIAHKVFGRVRDKLQRDPLVVDTRLIRCTMSAGIAASQPGVTDGVQWVEAAARALEAAQAMGTSKLVEA